MKKTITFFCLLAFLYFIPNAVAQCTTGELFPESTFTPNCNGNYQTITSQSWAGEYTNVNVVSNRQYSFSSSVTTDYITITNATGTVTYASGVQPVIWDSGSTTGVIRYYLHTNANCGSQEVNRTRYIRCADASNCTPPSNLAVTNITSNSCKMSWTAASPVPSSNYDIYIVTTNTAPTANSTPTLFSTTNLETTLYLNVAAGTTYYYWVRSNCGATTGVWVSGGSFTTPAALTCNGAVYGLYPDATYTPACTGNTEQIVGNAYAGEYSNVNILSNKQYTFTSSVTTDFVTITNANGTAVLASGTTPLIWLSGTNNGVIRYHLNTNSSCGTQNTNRAKSIKCAAIPCSAPTQLFYDGLTATSNNIAWTAPNPAPSNGYVYAYSTVNNPASANVITATTTNTFAVLNNLSPNTTYYFWVRSNCGAEQSNWVSGGSFTTPSASGCNAPTQLYYDGLTATTNTIAWIEGVPTPSNGYTYCYSTVNDPFNDSAIIGTTTETFANLTNLSPNTTYYFWITSNCGNTQSNWSTGSSFTTPSASGCNAPTQFWSSNVTSTTAEINWIPSTSAPNGGYLYVYNTTQTIGGMDGNTLSTTADLTDLLPNTTYYWWVASNCVTSQSAWAYGGSFTTDATTACNEPTQLFTDPESATVVNIAWVAPTPAPSNGYIYTYSTVNDPFSPNAITGTTTETFAVLNNLTPNTTYYFWVQSNCGATLSDRASGGSFTTQTLSAGAFSKKNLKLYPNPVNDILNLSFDNQITTVSIYNIVGQEVITKAVNSNETSINVAGLTTGTYLVKLTTTEGITIDRKMIKQ